MTKKILLILLGFLCFSSNIFSDIINTKVLKDPKTKKIIVLYGEWHKAIDEQSANQTRHILLQLQKLQTSQVNKNKETLVFFEGCSKCSKLDYDGFTQAICTRCSKTALFTYELLRKADHSGFLRLFKRVVNKDKNFINNIEGRNYCWLYIYLRIKHKLLLLLNAPKDSATQKNIELLKRSEKIWRQQENYFANDDLHLLIRLRHMILDCITNLEKIYSLTEDGIKRNIIPEIIKLKDNFVEIDKKIDAICLKLQVNELVKMYSPIAISNQIVSLLNEILIKFNPILDLTCLFEILSNSDMKKGIVFAGFAHTHNIARMLIKLGYEKIYDSFENEKNKDLKFAFGVSSEGRIMYKKEEVVAEAIRNSDRSFSDFDYILSNDLIESNEEITQMEIDDFSNFADNKSTKRKREQFEEETNENSQV